jgi:hypothetical protein
MKPRIRIFQNPSSVEVGDALEKLKLELNELQHDSILRSSFNQEVVTIFYASMPVSGSS